MKGFSRFSQALVTPVLFVVGAAFVRCIPNPDTSGLPPYDGGGVSAMLFDGGAFGSDAAFDATLVVEAGNDAGLADSAPAVGTITGLVIDYSQGSGKGVLPGAVVSVSFPNGVTPAPLPSPVTTDANGLFTLSNVPAGLALQVGVAKPTDLVNGVAYSTAYLSVTVAAGETVTVFPFLHEGCYQTWVLDPDAGTDAGNLPVTLQNATCFDPAEVSHGGAYAAMTFDPTAFKDPVTNTLWTKPIRVEMVPLAYPVEETGPDLSWSVGLPGTATPPGLLGAAQYRVVKSDPGVSDDGELLDLNNPAGDPVTIAIPLFTSPTAPQPLTYSYSAGGGGWTASTVLPGGLESTEEEVLYVNLQVSELGWWGVVNGTPETTCVTGTLQQAGAPVAGVLVRAAGVSYLGSSTGLTSATGSFCLDVAAAPLGEDAGVQIALGPESLAGGVPSSGNQLVTVTSPGGTASCAVPAGGCTPLGTIALSPSVGCVSGDVLEAGALPTLDVILETPNVATGFGIVPWAYLGQVSLGANGAFCALAPAGDLQLTQPGAANCYAGLTVPSAPPATACSAGGCADAGAVSFYCHDGLPQ